MSINAYLLSVLIGDENVMHSGAGVSVECAAGVDVNTIGGASGLWFSRTKEAISTHGLLAHELFKGHGMTRGCNSEDADNSQCQ